MILADKIIDLRKKNGWSQQELAEKMNVSRQSVSKWESAMSVPDLDKILQLGQIFGVSTDYLLKDEMEKEEYTVSDSDDDEKVVRRVSLEQANEFLSLKFDSARKIALGVFLCILSPICLLLMGVASDTNMLKMTEDAACGIGLLVLFLLVAAAVAIFVTNGLKTSKYEFLDKEPIETEYGVTGMVKEKLNEYAQSYSKNIVAGICTCILSVIPLFAGMFLTKNEFFIVLALCITMLIAGIGVILLISSGIKHSSMQKLLEEGDYTKKAKQRSPITEAVSTVFWLLATAIYLGYSFITDDWKMSWIVWPVAGVLYAGVVTICNAVVNSKNQK